MSRGFPSRCFCSKSVSLCAMAGGYLASALGIYLS